MVSTRSQLADSSQAAPESGSLSEEPVMVQPCGGDSVTVGTGEDSNINQTLQIILQQISEFRTDVKKVSTAQENLQKEFGKRDAEVRNEMKILRSMTMEVTQRLNDRQNQKGSSIGTSDAGTSEVRHHEQVNPNHCMSPDELKKVICKVTSLLDKYTVELDVSWYYEELGPSALQVWKGIAYPGIDENGKPFLQVDYGQGLYALPEEGVMYNNIKIVSKVPKDEETSDISGSELRGQFEESSFKWQKVRTWSGILNSGEPFSLDILENRLKEALQMPIYLNEELKFLWELLKQWMRATADRQNEAEDSEKHFEVGQLTLDRLRIKLGSLKGSDTSYVQSHYNAHRNSDDVLGNLINTSVNYNRGRGRGFTPMRGYRSGQQNVSATYSQTETNQKNHYGRDIQRPYSRNFRAVNRGGLNPVFYGRGSTGRSN